VWNANADNDAVTYLLGNALVRDGQVAKGEEVIDRMLRNGDSAEARFLMGTAKYMTGDYAGARTDLEKAIELNPHLPDVYAYYGKVLLASGDKAGSQKAFEQELQLNPNDFISNLELGILLRNDEKNAEAIKYFRHALAVHPGDPNARFEIAMTEVAQSQFPEAARDLESLVKDKPDFRQAVWQLATVYNRMGRKEDAERERAVYMKLNAAAQTENAEHQERLADRREDK
jgi:tetratricopeptide (TPR) repeat protein